MEINWLEKLKQTQSEKQKPEGLKTVPQVAFKPWTSSEVEEKRIEAGLKTIRSCGAEIHKDLNGIRFFIPADLETARIAEDAFIDIRPLLKKQAARNRACLITQ